MDDAKIVQLYWDRDERAISATSDKYGTYCASIAKNILGNKEDTEECVNDTYLNAWNSMPPHRPSILSVFLGKIVRNLSFNRYKYNTADKRGGGELNVVLEELSDLVSGKDDVEQEVDCKALVKAIDDFLETLTAKKRSIFISRYWYADSISEISARHGMKAGAVSMTLNRLRLKLHNYLLERGFEKKKKKNCMKSSATLMKSMSKRQESTAGLRDRHGLNGGLWQLVCSSLLQVYCMQNIVGQALYSQKLTTK